MACVRVTEAIVCTVAMYLAQILSLLRVGCAVVTGLPLRLMPFGWLAGWDSESNAPVCRRIDRDT
jgi:hypothetical protein